MRFFSGNGDATYYDFTDMKNFAHFFLASAIVVGGLNLITISVLIQRMEAFGK